MDSSGTTTRPCFIEEDDGLASLAEYSGTHHQRVGRNGFFSRPLCYQRRPSLRNLASFSSSSPRFARFYDAGFEDVKQPHFLDACFLCKKPLGLDNDIFMYRGDTPFCSEDCRQEQIDMDEAKEKNKSLSSSMKAMRKEQRKSTSPSKDQGYPFRTGTVAAA